MPEAAMDEDDSMMFRKHEVWPTVDVPSMQPIPEAARMQGPTKNQFGLRILALNPGHHPGSGLFVHDICHLPPGLGRLTWYTACY